MCKQVKWVWWLPVINAVAVGLLLWLVSGVNAPEIWGDEAFIAAIVLVYILIVLRLPIDTGSAIQPTSDADIDDDDDREAQALDVANPYALEYNPPPKPRQFLGHRYPAGANQPRKR